MKSPAFDLKGLRQLADLAKTYRILAKDGIMKRFVLLIVLTLPSGGCAFIADTLFNSLFDQDRPVDPAVLNRLGYAPGSREARVAEAEENNVRRAAEYGR